MVIPAELLPPHVTATSASSSRIGILITTCCFHRDIMLYTKLAVALTNSGAQVFYILPSTTTCSYKMRLTAPQEPTCATNFAATTQILAQSTIPHINLEQYCAPSRATSLLVDTTEEITKEALSLVESKWDIIKTSVARHCRWSKICEPRHLCRAEFLAALQFASAAAEYEIGLNLVINNFGLTHILIFNHAYYLEKIAARAAMKRGCKVVCSETSCFRDRRYLFIQCNTSDYRGGFREGALTAINQRRYNSKAEVQHIQATLSNSHSDARNSAFRQPPPNRGLSELRRRVAGRRVALFLGQVPYDASVTFGAEHVSMDQALMTIYHHFANTDGWFLVVRLHPGDSHSTTNSDHAIAAITRCNDQENILIVRGQEMNTYELMKLASIGITISSQAGLEMLAFYRPLVVLGNAFYRGLGVTSDGNLETFSRFLDDASKSAATPEWKERVNSVLGYWVNDYLVGAHRDEGNWTTDGINRALSLFLGSPPLANLAH